MELGTKIKDMRLQHGLTQEELADRCELTKGYISQLENDLTSPSIATLEDILSALGSSFADFFLKKKKMKKLSSEKTTTSKRDRTTIPKTGLSRTLKRISWNRSS